MQLYAGCVSQREGCICAACARNRSINPRCLCARPEGCGKTLTNSASQAGVNSGGRVGPVCVALLACIALATTDHLRGVVRQLWGYFPSVGRPQLLSHRRRLFHRLHPLTKSLRLAPLLDCRLVHVRVLLYHLLFGSLIG